MQGKKIIIAHKWNEAPVAQQTVATAMELSKNNDVIFLAQNKLPEGELQVNQRLRVMQWPTGRPSTIKDFVFYRKLLKEFKPDITIAHFAAINIMSLGGWLAKVPKRIAWYHTMTGTVDNDAKISRFKSALQRSIKKYFYKLNTHIASVSRSAGADLHENYNVPLSKITCIYNSVPTQQIDQTKVNPNLVRFIGRYDKSKGVDILIEAAAIVAQEYPSTIFEFRGNGNKDEYAQLASQKALSKNMIIEGPIQYEDVRKYMSEAYVTIVPSRFEAFGMIVIESLSVGTPVIGSNTGGIAEIIEDGQTGILFETGNAEKLAAAIKKMLTSPEKRNEMSNNCLSSFNNSFSIEAHISSVVSMLEH